jgi:proteic killer suppression protein
MIASMLPRIRLILTNLEAAQTVQGIDLPTFKLHPLKGKLKGFWAVTVRANWRIIFKFANGNVYDVDFLDYH